MSDLDNAINSINASAAKAENTAGFLDDMSTFDDQSSVTNPNNGQTVASIPKQVKDRTDELFAAAESDINQAVSDAAQSATDAQDAADSIGRYQGLWPDTGGSAYKGDTYQTQVSGTPTGQYFTALQNTTVDPVGDDVNWRSVVSNQSLGSATNYQAASVEDMIAGKPVGWQGGGAVITHSVGQVWTVGVTNYDVSTVSDHMTAGDFKESLTLGGDTIYDVMFCYGQSNCLGKPSLSGSTSGFPDIGRSSLMWDVDTSSLIPMRQNFNSWARDSDSASTGSAWAAFANEWYERTGRGIIMVMGASGGKRIEELSKGYSLGLYENAIEGMTTLDAHLAANPEIKIGVKFCMWHQGESDQSYGTSWLSYFNQLSTLWGDLQADIGITDFGVCLVGNPSNRTELSWNRIKNAQRHWCNQASRGFLAFEGCGSFNLANNTIGSEGVHYTQRGYNVMGRSAAISASTKIFGDQFPISYEQAGRENLAISCDYGERPVQFSAVISYDGSDWVIRTKDISGQSFRSMNVQSISTESDHLAVTLSGHVTSLLNFRAGVSDSINKNRNINAITDFMVENDNTIIRIFFNSDITVGVRTDTGDIRQGVPLVTASASSLIGSIFSSTTDGTTTTLSHNKCLEHPQATFANNSSMSDLDYVVRMAPLGETSTKVSVTKVDGTTSGMGSIQAAVLFKNMQLLPDNMIYDDGLQINLTGSFLI